VKGGSFTLKRNAEWVRKHRLISDGRGWGGLLVQPVKEPVAGRDYMLQIRDIIKKNHGKEKDEKFQVGAALGLRPSSMEFHSEGKERAPVL